MIELFFVVENPFSSVKTRHVADARVHQRKSGADRNYFHGSIKPCSRFQAHPEDWGPLCSFRKPFSARFAERKERVDWSSAHGVV